MGCESEGHESLLHLYLPLPPDRHQVEMPMELMLMADG